MTESVLLTGIGGDIAQNIAIILKESNKDIFLVGTDIHSRHGGKYFVDQYLNVPKAGSPEYVDSIHNIIDDYSIDTVFPLTESELENISSLMCNKEHIHWITAGKEVINIGLDKIATMTALENIGISVPWTVPVAKAAPISYPCIMKNRTGSGSKNIVIVKNDLEAAMFSKKYPDAIFQELLFPDENEVTCAIYKTRRGEIHILQMLRQLSGGLTTWARVIHNSKIESLCRNIASSFNLQGSMNVQLRITSEGPMIFEINPRFSSTVLMRHRAGYQDVLWSIKDTENQAIIYKVVPESTILIRKYDAFTSQI